MPTFFDCFMATVTYVSETPAGAIDGINTTFTLSQIPEPPEFLRVFLLKNAPSATLQTEPTNYTYTLVGGITPTIEFVSPPLVTEGLLVTYYECAAFGVMVKCEKCNKPASKSLREWWHRNMESAQQEIEDIIGCPICPTEICREKVYLCDCPTNLKKRPVAYLGKKVLIESREMTICYQELSDCGADLPFYVGPSCDDQNDLIGVINIMDLPTDYDFDLINFRYPDFLCYNTKQVLQQPTCLNEMVYGDITYGVEAIWPKCYLIHPNCTKAKLADTECFLETIVVEFWKIDEDLAIEIPNKCDCCSCPSTPNCGYEIELGDEHQAEVCVTPSDCSCSCHDDYVYVNYATAYNCGDPDRNMNRMLSLLALLKHGNKKFCDCESGNDYIQSMLELDPSFVSSSSPFDVAKNFPFGKTRAGIEVKKLLEQIKNRRIIQGQAETLSGGMTHGINPKTKPFKNGSRNW